MRLFSTLTLLITTVSAYASYETVANAVDKDMASGDDNYKCTVAPWKVFRDNVPLDLQQDLYNNFLDHIHDWGFFYVRYGEPPYQDYFPEDLDGHDERLKDVYGRVIANCVSNGVPYGIAPSDWSAKNKDCVGGRVFEELFERFHHVFRPQWIEASLEDLADRREIAKNHKAKEQQWNERLQREKDQELQAQNAMQGMKDMDFVVQN